ncbi:NAD(P)-dependent alcohol dehydrogenase [Agrococcus beijingensis]|uniref:NAD(P)-dependent alcohol dehydrogenase n=1 Tax=Agrococcus beijingensis TaxID=3068634 RepID=UPI0027414468|nr:NAD(P)-dependent alcohol dehydrogenase [Agrococcus sp. REN33]
MRAAIVPRYGPPSVARLVDLPTPEPRAGQVLVRVAAAAVNSGDARMRSGSFPRGFGVVARLAIGMRGPRRRVLGTALSGTVEAIGEGVAELAVGDEVAGMPNRLGGHAELASVRAKDFVRKPAGVSHDAAAAVLFGGTTAMHFLLDVAGLRAGQTVLVIGASGAVGTSAVQVARLAGARVTGVASTGNAELVRRLGAERVIDYARSPVERLDERFDVVVDTVGGTTASRTRLLAEGGTLLQVLATLGQTVTARGRVKAGVASVRPEHMRQLLAQVASGELDPVVQALPLAEIARAHEIVDSGRKVGNLVVNP